MTTRPDTRPTVDQPGARAPVVLVATDDGLLDSSGDDRLAGQHVTSVTSANGAVWAMIDGTELVRISDSGVERRARLDDGVGVCVHVHRDVVHVGGSDGALWYLDEDRLRRVAAFEQAPTRSDWYTPWGGPPSVFSIASLGDDLYVGVHVGGIMHRAGGRDTWSATIDLHDDVHQVAVDPTDGTVWAATGMSGLAQSDDHGTSWRYHTDGLHATYLLAVAVTNAGVLVGASSGHAARDGRVYLFDRTGFERVHGLPDHLDGAVAPRRLAGHADHAALATPDGELHLSDDGGRTWRRADLPPKPGRSIDEVHLMAPDRPSSARSGEM